MGSAEVKGATAREGAIMAKVSEISGRAKRALAGMEDFGRRQPLVVLAGGAAVGAAAARTVKIPALDRGRSDPKRSQAGNGTKASSYGRDNPSGPGYNWPPEPAVAS
jgi:hypothetical protein